MLPKTLFAKIPIQKQYFAIPKMRCIFDQVKKKIRLALAVFLPIQVIAVFVLRHYPLVVERVYSHGIFPVVSVIERYALGWIPFSVGDFLYLFFGIVLIRWIYKRFKTRFRQPKRWIVQAISSLSVLYFCFHFFWGLNYDRLPLHRSLEIENTYSHAGLVALTKNLIERSNALQHQLAKNDTVKVNFPFTNSQIRKLAVQGYTNVSGDYPNLEYRGRSIKPSLFSVPLAYMGFNGYLNPLTGEAQVNNRLPKFKLPSVTAHEMGHQLGFAKENEANFMACLTTMNHPNPYFEYAGYTFALKYCLREVHAENPEEAKALSEKLHPGVLKNYQEVKKFWKEHQNPFEPFFKLFYTHYLKANNQPEGLQSYNYVVALLVNYFKDERALD